MTEFLDIYSAIPSFIGVIIMPALLLGGSLGLKLKFNKETIFLLLILAPAYNYIFHYHCGFSWFLETSSFPEFFIFKILGSQITAITALFISSKVSQVLKDSLKKLKN